MFVKATLKGFTDHMFEITSVEYTLEKIPIYPCIKNKYLPQAPPW